MRIIFQQKIKGQTRVTCYQRDSDLTFRVVYGKQVYDRLNYGQASHQIGLCLMHAVTMTGRILEERATTSMRGIARWLPQVSA